MSLTPILTHNTLLAAVAILARLSGVTLRVSDAPWPRLAGWLVCALAAWGAAGAAGAFSPVWPVLLVAVAGALREWRERSGWTLAVAGDAAMVFLLLLTSTPRLPLQTAAGFLLALLLVWGGSEAGVRLALWWADRAGSARVWSAARRVVAGGASLLALVLIAAAAGRDSGQNLLPIPSMLPHLAVTSQCEGERLTLSGGGVGWLEGPGRWGWTSGGAEAGEAGIAALLLHGHDRRASGQPSACVLRRALVHAGFLTLALDHPGYGDASPPAVDDPLEAWDFQPTLAEAYDWLAARPDVRGVIVVGHSMGAQNAIRLAAARPDIPLFFLLAASIRVDLEPEEEEELEDWYARFHQARELADSLPRRRWREIERLYYDGRRALRSLPSDHGLVVFGAAEHEWDNVTASRTVFFELIPGAKEWWELSHTSHYFNSFQMAGVTVGDARVVRRLAAGMRSWTGGVLGASGDPGPGDPNGGPSGANGGPSDANGGPRGR